MWVQHLSSLDFLTYVAFFGVVVAVICRFVPGKAAPVRTEPYSEDELARHDARLAKYFVAGGGFLVLGAVHMTLKNLPWVAEWLGVPRREGAHGQVVQGSGRRGRRDHGPRLLVLRGERVADRVPGTPGSRAEAAGPPVEVLRNRCGG